MKKVVFCRFDYGFYIGISYDSIRRAESPAQPQWWFLQYGPFVVGAAGYGARLSQSQRSPAWGQGDVPCS